MAAYPKENLHSFQPVLEFTGAWKVFVRDADIFFVDSVERSFQGGPFNSASSQDIKCEALAVWWKNVEQCLSDDVFVAPLSDCFVRLLFQLVSRLSTWVATGIEYTESGVDGMEVAYQRFQRNSLQ